MPEIRRYAAAGWRHRWKALLLAWLVCLGGWSYVYSMPNQYRSSARVYAEGDAILGQLLNRIAVDSLPAAQVELLLRTLLSRPNLERLLARTGLDLQVENEAARERLLTVLAREVRIVPQSRNLFTITYTDDDPRTARDVVQTLVTFFMEQANTGDQQQMQNARVFLNRQIASYEVQLRDAERRRADFRARYADLLPSDGGLSRLETARGRLQQLAGDLQDANTRREVLRQQLAATPATLSPAEVAAGLGGGGGDPRIAEAERQLRELRLRFTEQHPDVIAARNAIAELRAAPRLSSEQSSRGVAAPRAPGSPVPNPLYEQIRVRLLDADSQIASLDRRIRQEREEIARFEELARTAPQVQAEFQNLDRDYNVMLRSYQELLERREALQLAGAARTGADRVRLEIVDPPILPTEPVGPNRKLFYTTVLAIGLGAGAVLAFLLAQLDRSFYTVHDLRKLGLPVIGSISSTQPERRRLIGAAAFGCGVLVLLAAYAAMSVGGDTLIARLPGLVARFTA